LYLWAQNRRVWQKTKEKQNIETKHKTRNAQVEGGVEVSEEGPMNNTPQQEGSTD
jgi:hypothetical protein